MFNGNGWSVENGCYKIIPKGEVLVGEGVESLRGTGKASTPPLNPPLAVFPENETFSLNF